MSACFDNIFPDKHLTLNHSSTKIDDFNKIILTLQLILANIVELKSFNLIENVYVRIVRFKLHQIKLEHTQTDLHSVSLLKESFYLHELTNRIMRKSSSRMWHFLCIWSIFIVIVSWSVKKTQNLFDLIYSIYIVSLFIYIFCAKQLLKNRLSDDDPMLNGKKHKTTQLDKKNANKTNDGMNGTTLGILFVFYCICSVWMFISSVNSYFICVLMSKQTNSSIPVYMLSLTNWLGYKWGTWNENT